MSLLFNCKLLGKQFSFSLQQGEDQFSIDALLCGNVKRSYTITVGADEKYVAFHYIAAPFLDSRPLRVIGIFISFVTDSIEGRNEQSLMRKYNVERTSQIIALSQSMQLRYNILQDKYGSPEDLLDALMEVQHTMFVEENLELLNIGHGK